MILKRKPVFIYLIVWLKGVGEKDRGGIKV